MIEKFIQTRFAPNQYKKCFLIEDINRLSDYFEENGYSRKTIDEYFRCIAHYSYWLKRDKERIINKESIHEFLSNHLQNCKCKRMNKNNLRHHLAALNHLLKLHLPKVKDANIGNSQIEQLVKEYCFHLEMNCGQAFSTRKFWLFSLPSG
jgi:hypothetical protein